jgi:outer membrane protein OmpA-like peptidoglycan-associated protein
LLEIFKLIEMSIQKEVTRKMQLSTLRRYAPLSVLLGLATGCAINSPEPSSTPNASPTQPPQVSESQQKAISVQKPTVQPLDIEKPTIQRPTIQRPTIKRPTIKIPEITIPEIKIPEITIPEIRVQQDKDSTIITITSDILFDFDQATIRPDAAMALRQINAAIAKRYAQNSMIIQGHTDAIGSNAYNQTLSNRRALAVKQWLAQQGNVSPSRMGAIGYGESRPVAPNTNPDGSDNPAGRQQNRRVAIVIQHRQ